MRDVKELVGLLMRALGGEEIAEAEVADLQFEAEGELLDALNAAYIGLLEFVHDRAQRNGDPERGRAPGMTLQEHLDRIVALCDAAAPPRPRAPFTPGSRRSRP